MGSYLRDQLDQQVRQATRLGVAGPGSGLGAFQARFPAGGSSSGELADRDEAGPGRLVPLDRDVLDELAALPPDNRAQSVDLPGLGGYRVVAEPVPGGTIVGGLPESQVSETLGRLIWLEVLLALLATVAGGGAALVVVRRQLRPLREVAATAESVAARPLATGEVDLAERVPEHLTDERTEVGQVGAALNTLLAHVETSLDARHRSEQQVRQFVADASHELRTPLSTIHGYAELSRRTQPADPEQLAHAMSKVEAEATRMSTLVEDLLLLARLDAGRPLARDEVDLTKLVLESVGDARVVGPEHRWLLDLGDDPVVVTGDEQRLHQVVTNLLGNVRRHTPPGTSVTVGVREHGDCAVLTVQDDGPGMSPALVRTAFERFSRGDSSRTRASGGAGLGLSLVQAITSAHGGSVGVESRPARTVFEVRLPVSGHR
jgi:two-component system OmpR family sensor kinase